MPFRLFLALCCVLSLPALATLTLVSANAKGESGDGLSRGAVISADGRYVAFMSAATNLLPGDTNGKTDIYLYDARQRMLARISMGVEGAEANGDSSSPAISADGNCIAYVSAANNLVMGDTNGVTDIFVYEQRTGLTTRVSVSTSGRQAQGASTAPAISSDGRYVAFRSAADNLLPNDTNGFEDIFVRDRQQQSTTRASVATDGMEANGPCVQTPSISADGRYVAFASHASNLDAHDTNDGLAPDIFLRDRADETTLCISRPPHGTTGIGASNGPSLSADGRFVAFASFAGFLVSGDTNRTTDIFVYDRQAKTLVRESVNAQGVQANDASTATAISGDGRCLVYLSYASNLVARDENGFPDVFLRDRATGATLRVNTTANGEEADDDSSGPAINADGSAVVFTSWAGTLLARGFSHGDVYLYTRE